MAGLEYGTSSPEVAALQKRIAAYKLGVKVTGEMDDQTVAAVNELAARIGLNATFKSADDKFLKALDAWEKQTFHQISFNGKKFIVTDDELEQLRKVCGPKAEAEVMPFVRMAEEAKGYWDAHKGVKEENWFWGNVVEITTRASFPSASTMDAAVSAAADLRSKARALTLTPAELDRNVAKIEKALNEMRDYRTRIFDGGETVIKGLEVVRDGCIITLQIGAAIGTGGASIGAQAAAAAGVAGYAAALGEIDRASKQSDYKLEMGLGRVAWAMTADAAVTAIFKGAKGSQVTDAIKKKVLNEAPKALSKYLVDAAAKGIEGLVSDGIKNIPKLMDPNHPLTLEEIVKAGVSSFLKNAGVAVLGPVAEKYSKGAASKFTPKDFQSWAKGKKLDKPAEEALKKAIDAAGQGAVDFVLSKWTPNQNHAKFEEAVRKRIAEDSRVQAALKKAK